MHSIVELLLLPSLVCSLYAFINEKSWRFQNTISGFSFVLFLYSIAIDTFYGKFYLIWLLQKVIRLSYNKYDYLQDEEVNRKTKLCRYISPLYMMIPLTVMLTMLHWFMLAIVGVRIYVDNFSVERNSSKIEPTAGSYASTSFTRFMIACSIYLPIGSCIVYIILNKHWFYEVYSVIKQSSTSAVYIESVPLTIKFLSFVVDPIAYVLASILIFSFIAFTIGTFLPDYEESDFEVTAGARTAAEILGILFVLLFLLSNIQATVVFSVLVVTAVVILTVVSLVIVVVFVVIVAAIVSGVVVGSCKVLELSCNICCAGMKYCDSDNN